MEFKNSRLIHCA